MQNALYSKQPQGRRASRPKGACGRSRFSHVCVVPCGTYAKRLCVSASPDVQKTFDSMQTRKGLA
ncbi:hypothetical protein HMPREF0762_00341 [Slackia exigua ATCC 700122]|uniref:Uncharacterized protein n=1 Tax=Slackia exigua (strain ATCC 700122 / DSM 15923 / CIP 105133 / JCM 11022 / KCTC 5966 / S-7) TaxID=649764 RepID=D0WEV7_SLAES|nr:hypothetical protein HMPREF0762_00341 [Slackia exigua ATCC 700122]